MSAIQDLIKACEALTNGAWQTPVEDKAIDAFPDIKRIVEWVSEFAPHDKGCQIAIDMGNPCTCGLSEIQSLIRS